MFLVACGSEKPAARDAATEAGGGGAGASGMGGAGSGGMAGNAGMGGAGGSVAGMDGGAAGAAGMDAAMPDPTTDAAETGSDGAIDNDAAADASSDGSADGSADASPEASSDASPDASPDESTSDGATSDGPAPEAPTGCATDCDDHNPCTDDTCDVSTGACHNTANTAACNDGNACTTVDQCSAGQCVGSVAPGCDDQNACTTDSCDPAVGCVHPAVVCNDSSSCTDDMCLPATGCTFVDNGSCAAPDAGTDAGADADAEAEAGADAEAEAGADTGADVSAPGCAIDADCNDNDQCTNDVCNGGTCAHVDTSASCNDNNSCTTDSCTPQDGCVHTTASDGTACDDGFTCATDDTCVAGVCEAGTTPQFTGLIATGSAGGDPSLAVDGDSTTSFSPTAANPRWIYVDLGADRQISRAQLDWGTTTYGGYYTLQVAGDTGHDATTLATDAAWTSIYTQSLWDNATGHSDDITELNAVGRYLRVYHWLPKTNFAVATTTWNLRELKVFGGAAPACTTPPGACAESTVAAGPTTYENDATGNACAVVNGGAACGTTTGAGITGTATIISARGVLSFANVDGGSIGGAATVTFNAAGATSSRKAAAVYVKYEDGTEQGYGPITTASTTFGPTQSVQVWLKSGAHNTIEVRDSAGAADVNGLPIVDSVTVTRHAGPSKACVGTPFVVDSFEGAPTNDWNLSVAAGVTSGDRRGISKSGTVNTAFQGNATSATNPPTGDICLRMDVANYSWTTKLSNMDGLDNAYVQLILGANTGTPTITLALTADGVNFNTPVVLTANNANTNNGYGIIRNNMTNADTTTSKVLVPLSAFGVQPGNLKLITGLRATISGNIWRIKDIQIVR